MQFVSGVNKFFSKTSDTVPSQQHRYPPSLLLKADVCRSDCQSRPVQILRRTKERLAKLGKGHLECKTVTETDRNCPFVGVDLISDL